MSQLDIMEFFDKHPNRLFTAAELTELFAGKLGNKSIHRSLSRIIKREEYCAVLEFINGHYRMRYGRSNIKT